MSIDSKSILIAGESRGSLEILALLATALTERDVLVKVVALGTKQEASALGSKSYRHVVTEQELPSLLDGISCVIVGLTGQASKETKLCFLANQLKILSVGVVDNIHDMSCRVNPNSNYWPTHVMISGGSPDLVRQQLQHFPKSRSEEFLERTSFVGNMRAAIRPKEHSEAKIETNLTKILTHSDISWPDTLSNHNAPNELFDGTLVPITYFSNNIHWQSKHWNSYGYSESKRRQIHEQQIETTTSVLRKIDEISGVQALVRPHPAETCAETHSLCDQFNAIYVPHSVCDTLNLAKACGHAISPPSSVADICAFNNIRCLLIAVDGSEPSMIYSAQIGAVQAINESEHLLEGINHLVDRTESANISWNQKHQAAKSVESPIREITEYLLDLVNDKAELEDQYAGT